MHTGTHTLSPVSYLDLSKKQWETWRYTYKRLVTNKFELRDSRVASTIDVVTIKEDQLAVAGVIIICALDLVDRRNIVISTWNWPGGSQKDSCNADHNSCS